MNTTREALLQDRGLSAILGPPRNPANTGARNRIITRPNYTGGSVIPAPALDLSAIRQMPGFSGRQAGAPVLVPATSAASSYIPPAGGTAAERAAAIRQARIDERRASQQALSAQLYQASLDAAKAASSNSQAVPDDVAVFGPPPSSALGGSQTGQVGGGTGSGGSGSGNETSSTSKTSKSATPPSYPDEGSALSAEVFGALAERRRVVDEELQRAMEQERFQNERLRLAADTARTQVAREFRNLSEDLMMSLGGRGLATDPRFAARGQRRLQAKEDEKFGEISQTLADEIAALQEMVQKVSDARDRELAKIAQDEALARTMPSALLPASLQYSSS